MMKDQMANMTRRLTLSLAIVAILSLILSCGGGPSKSTKRARYVKKSSISSALKAQYRDWKGVRYRIGGLSKKGVDCSGFVHLTFKKRLGRSIPRTTKSLSKYGKKIGRGSLKPGDLVFFKTGRKVRHVGIYYGGNKFLHASTSKGVMLSRMDDIYWGKRYWQSRRVL
jgi:cell wall-associated NlpC family hydrolase